MSSISSGSSLHLHLSEEEEECINMAHILPTRYPFLIEDVPSAYASSHDNDDDFPFVYKIPYCIPCNIKKELMMRCDENDDSQDTLTYDFEPVVGDPVVGDPVCDPLAG